MPLIARKAKNLSIFKTAANGQADRDPAPTEAGENKRQNENIKEATEQGASSMIYRDP